MILDALIVTPSQAEQIATINDQFHDRALVPVPIPDGRAVLPALLLDDCGPGGWLVAYRDLLLAMKREDVDIPEVEE